MTSCNPALQRRRVRYLCKTLRKQGDVATGKNTRLREHQRIIALLPLTLWCNKHRNLNIILKLSLFSPVSPYPQLSLTTAIPSVISLHIIELFNIASGRVGLQFLSTSV